MNPDSGRKFVLCVAGGGHGIIGEITGREDMSSLLLEAVIAGSPASFRDLTGDATRHGDVARAAAMACYMRARRYGTDDRVFGVACVADPGGFGGGCPPVRIVVQDYDRTEVVALEFAPGRQRGEENVITRVLRAVLCECCDGRHDDLTRHVDAERERLHVAYCHPDQHVRDIIHGVDSRHPRIKPPAIVPGADSMDRSVLAHILAHAEQRLGCPPAVELCLTPPGGPPLDYITVDDRRRSLAPLSNAVILTNRPSFFDKAALFPGAVFVVVEDAFNQILLPSRYPGGGTQVFNGLLRMGRCGGRFLVYPIAGYRPINEEGMASLYSFAINKLTDVVDDFE